MTLAASQLPEISGYTITEQLYLGSRNAVYRATLNNQQLPVVIKVLQREYPTFGELVQFRNQYVIGKNLPIAGIIQPLSLEPFGNGYALVMADWGGISLDKYIQQQPLDLGEILHLAIQLADILHELHQHRVIHKDIKPANILIHPESKQVKLIDLSIASMLPKETQEIQNPNALEGTLAYLAPEQTGRMNRAIDSRSDFYAFGVTLYQLLTGRLPFITDDPLELVHCHIAKMPTSVHEVNTEVPAMVGAIVAKLMAKNAEDRYQSATGLKHDLQQCLTQWKQTGSIGEFELGQRDLSDRFIIPEKLYGRETEVQTLLDAFERIAQGSSEMMLVAGFSGIGKTAVVNEIHKPIVRQRGYFIKGKFDQFNRNIPFSAFVQAFRDLVGQLLSESDAQLQTWKTRILQALGDNAQVILELIPELEGIIGTQPPAPELSGTAAQNRFNLLFQKFIEVFTTPAHPLVMFVDDLQWADSASLNLIQVLMSESQTGCLLLLGAYRDNEIFVGHPLMLTLNGMEKAKATIHTITLQPLNFTSLNHLVADTLHAREGVVKPLTELVMQKTQGNPFFATQFLKALYQDQLITFDQNAGHWQCDIVQVRDAALTDDVVEFMALQLQKLPESTQQILKLAACIGAQFDLETLAIVSQQSQTEVATTLWKALQEGLILPITKTYKFFQDADTEPSAQVINVPYKFLHDRVQQAAYSLIPEDQKQTTHLKIGQLLSSVMNPTEKEERFFEIINHLNKGVDLIHSKTEREELVKLNLEAAQKAKSATAYIAAIEYANKGREMLTLNCWQEQYEITLSLYNLAAEASCLIGDFRQMQQIIDEVVKNARNLLDKVKVYEVKILAYVAQSQQPEAIRTALSVLELFGIVFPDHPTATDIYQSLKKTQDLLQEKDLADLLTLPEMTDLPAIAKMHILATVTAAVYQAVPELLPLIVCKQVRLSVEYGNAAVSAQAFAWYGVILCSTGEIDFGDRIGEIAIGLLSRFPNREFKASTINMVYPFVKPWKHHIQDSLAPLLDGYHSGLEMGTLEYAAYCAYNYCSLSYFLGKNLSSLESEIHLYNQALAQLKQEVAHNYLRIFYQSVANLLTANKCPWEIKGVIYDEQIMLPLHQKANDLYAMGTLYINKLILCYFFNQWESAIEAATEAKQYLSGVSGCFMVPLFHFYDSLTYIATLPNTQDKDLQKVVDNQNKLKKWSHHAPTNHLHKFYLVEAERYRVLGQMYEAMDYYDRAIAGAKANGFIQEEALANELAAKFYLHWGKQKVAPGYMQEAYYCYAKWGAKAKVVDLETRYPDLLRPILQQAEASKSILSTLVTLSCSMVSSHISTRKSSSSTNINQSLDFATILKASQALSSTIQFDELIHQLTQIILQNSGADRCALILPSDSGEWQVRAYATPNETQLCTEPLTNNPHIPVKLIQYVKNTQEVVVIDNMETTLPVIGDYLRQNQPKSVLCLPLLHQGHLIGILYLKNRLTRGLFTEDRILILNFLCTQAAISLENARLYTAEQEKARQFAQLNQKLSLTQFSVDHAANGIFWMHPDASFFYVNQTACEMLEYSPEELMTLSVMDIDPNVSCEFWEAHRQEVKQRTSLTVESSHQSKSGRIYPVEISVNYLEFAGQEYYVGIIRDISERKRAEKSILEKTQALKQALNDLQGAQLQIVQSEKMASLGNLVAGVAHEINNPIGFLNGSINNAKDYVQDLLDYIALYQEHHPQAATAVQDKAEEIDVEFLTQDLPKLLDSMQGATDRIKGISTSLRTFSRADTEYKISVNIHDGINSTLLILKYRLKANEFRPAIAVIQNYGDLPEIKCFPGQLNQVFMNILANAIDMFDEMAQSQSFEAIKANPQEITIHTQHVGEQVLISIRDNGKGMSQQVQAKIFDHLFTTKPVGKGTGLGLVIARQIVVEKHGGKLEVQSQLDQGSEFCIYLPISSQ